MPPELRLMIYENLLVAEKAAPVAGKDRPTPKTTLGLSILRVNRQIHDEAAAVLYNRNTIRITPPAGPVASAATIPPRYRHLVRNLSVEVLHCPDTPSLGWHASTEPLGTAENREVATYRAFSFLLSPFLASPIDGTRG
ncbi:hypothetical protein BU23DRAFT_550227 [Bimuria novae-zelandiae CBS 107.79]|uniref:Uncharacterized protein n=1 Tax=Bimuria novae-zelandiae CBS 107.79 TaxID=1447943 RepID=A0A6A5VR30_9PLEO|nr:hypothetical protein BU23DRAFT_550227 [Bimuria novae-zelandiae CBS 107.79]